MRIPVIVLFAPTASGKTALALNLFGNSSHSFFKGKVELISADSMQVYKGFDIGTAKPDAAEQSELKHHLIDLYEPQKQFTVADFVSECDVLCRNIYEGAKIPLIAGGTGFYIRNFILGLPPTPVSDEKIRNQLKERMILEGRERLYAELQKIDPESASKININDEYRICRALEVFYITGKPRSSFKVNLTPRDCYDFTVLVLERSREELYERINRRVDIMFENGLVQEVEKLVADGCTFDMPAMQAIGYSQFFDCEGKIRSDLNKVREQIKHDSRKYAKKQYTFMADIPGAKIIDASDSDRMISEVSENIRHLFE